MKKSVLIFLVLGVLSIAMLTLAACGNNPDTQVQLNPHEPAAAIYVITAWGNYGYRVFPSEQLEITDDATRHELLEIIAT